MPRHAVGSVLVRTLAILALVGLFPGCALTIDFVECQDDVDCNRLPSDTRLHCTRDHLCVSGSPLETLCTGQYPASSPGDAIVIGALVNRDYGNDALLLKSYQLAIDELNEIQMRPERKFMLRICEINADWEDPLKSMRLLAKEPNLVAVVGPTTSLDVISIKGEVIRSGIPIVSPGATSPEITLLGNGSWPVNGLFFRVVPSDSLQGPVLANIALKVAGDNKNIAMLYVDEPYGRGLKNAVVDRFNKLGRQVRPILSYEEPLGTPDPQKIDTQIGLIIDSGTVDIIAIPNRHSAQVLESIANHPKSPMNVQHIIMGEGGKNEATLAMTTRSEPQILPILKRLLGSAPAVNMGHKYYQRFQDKFRAYSSFDANSTVFTASAYDAIYAIALAIGAAHPDVSPARVSAMLSRLNGCLTTPGSARHISVGQDDYTTAKRELSTQSVGMVLDGLSGEICFTPHGDRVDGQYEKWWINTDKKMFAQEPEVP